jgi:hypothetical protein
VNQPQVNAPDLAKVVKAANVEARYIGDDVVIHAVGCQHKAKSRRSPWSINVAEAVKYADDWFYVAPCAKKAV